MTREEAINEIKSWAIPSKKGREVLETLIPELRENKDENVKNKSGYYKAGKFWKASTLWNATKNKIPQRVSNKYILQECTWNIGTLQRFADEVKNVQEVSLDYPIILDMNGNILDGAHRVVKAYLEGKDIDIVYLGDDEWPEPDYDEEKAVRRNDDERIKKSLIEFLTDIKEISESGRTSWAVRKEDAEMCKSFIAWLKKQKENPKSADSIPSDCMSDAECEDRWHKMVDSLPDNPREVLCKDEAGNYFIGRYYVGEGWEISNYDDEDKPHHLNPPVSKWIDFPSEKQKEQNGEDEFLEDELSAFLQNYDKEYDDDAAVSDVARHFYEIGKKQNEQKPHTDEEKEYIRTIKSIISDFIRDKKPENLAYYQRIYDWLDGRHVPFSCGHENGKPADPVFSKQEYESHPIISTDTTSAKPVELDGKTLLYTADKSYQIGFRDGVASVKPAECSKVTINGEPIPTETKSVDIPLAEWSKEDEEMRGTCIDLLEHFPRPCGEVIGPWKDCISWLKSLPERFNLQPKQEWSEEDEKDVAHIIRVLDDCYAYGKHDLSKTDHENLVGTLKSLRPSWKPSEEQMKAFGKSINDTSKTI